MIMDNGGVNWIMKNLDGSFSESEITLTIYIKCIDQVATMRKLVTIQ